MHENAWLRLLVVPTKRRPDLDFVTAIRQPAGYQTRVVADAAVLRRIFTGEYVPTYHNCTLVFCPINSFTIVGPSVKRDGLAEYILDDQRI
jgi:hypothetical protein